MLPSFLPKPITRWPLAQLCPYAREACTHSGFSLYLPGRKVLMPKADDLLRRGGVLVVGMG